VGHRLIAVLASTITMALVTVLGVLFFFLPISSGDTVAAEWPPLIAVLVYVLLSIALFDWAAIRIGSSFSAAIVIAGAQFIFIVDLLARGERGVMTALAGTGLLAITWVCVAFVHSRLSNVEKH
jgi:hypothetical protein